MDRAGGVVAGALPEPIDRDMKERIGFIGLGIMGRGMSHNLLKAGFDLTVWNRTAARMQPLIEAGAAPASDPADVASRSDVVLICVRDTPDVEEVLFGERGVLAGARPGMLVVDLSTISPEATEAFAAKLAERDVHLLDAPVSGGSEGAEQGTLSIMVGGEADQFERAKPVFDAIGRAVRHVGGHGDGQRVKLVNQILVVLNMLAVGEALLFAEASGLDLERTLDAVTQGAAGSWMLSHRGPQVVARDWRPGFTIDLQQKDLRLVLEAADARGVPLLGTSTVFQLYRTLQARGLGAEGNHALVKALETLSGIEIGSRSAVGGQPG